MHLAQKEATTECSLLFIHPEEHGEGLAVTVQYAGATLHRRFG